MPTKWISLVLAGFMSLVTIYVSPPARGGIQIRTARLELVRIQRQYRLESHLSAARGFEDGLLNFTVEFENAGLIRSVTLESPRTVFADPEKEGEVYVFQGFVGPVSTLDQGTYRVRVLSTTGAETVFPFTLILIEFGDWPEVKFPIDGMDEADADDLQARWGGSGDSYRVDLFEIRSDLFNHPPDLAQLLRTWHPFSGTQSLEADLFPNRRYEIWIGSTEEDTVSEDDYDVEIDLTSSLFLRFTTGPEPRERIDGFQPDEKITTATVGIRKVRRGQSNGEVRTETEVARVEGQGIGAVEAGKIRGRTDGRLSLGATLETLLSLPDNRTFEAEVDAVAGDAFLFLVEFTETGRLGSETAVVDAPIPCPELLKPRSNESGLGNTIRVEWSYSAPVDSFVVSLSERNGTFDLVSDPLDGQARALSFPDVPPNRDYDLEVTAYSEGGSSSKTSVLVSTRAQGDFDSNGKITGKDLLGFALAWQSTVSAGTPDVSSASTVFRLDFTGDETLNEEDLHRFIGEVR